MQNKSKLNTILLVIIIILIVVGLVYFFYNNSKKKVVLPIVDNSQQNINTKNSSNQDEHTYSSDTFGYSIGYSGVDTKSVYIEGDGRKVNLFPNQSYIDSLEIIDSSYVMPKHISSIGKVVFGANEYQKFKDNVSARHTYYLKSGLKNGKSIFISIENDSDNPPYLNLASLKIQSPVVDCNTGYEKTAESKIISEESPVLITGFEKKCDGYYYFTFDYLGPGQGTPESGNPGSSYYTNTSFKLRTLKMDQNLKVKLTDNTEVSLISYGASLKKAVGKVFNQDNAYYGLSGQPVFQMIIKDGLVIQMNENYLP